MSADTAPKPAESSPAKASNGRTRRSTRNARARESPSRTQDSSVTLASAQASGEHDAQEAEAAMSLSVEAEANASKARGSHPKGERKSRVICQQEGCGRWGKASCHSLRCFKHCLSQSTCQAHAGTVEKGNKEEELLNVQRSEWALKVAAAKARLQPGQFVEDNFHFSGETVTVFSLRDLLRDPAQSQSVLVAQRRKLRVKERLAAFNPEALRPKDQAPVSSLAQRESPELCQAEDDWQRQRTQRRQKRKRAMDAVIANLTEHLPLPPLSNLAFSV
ncbi:unnamed protein product [Chrysoparadoxa australica]